MEKDKRLMEASWWERLTEGKIGSCSNGWGHAQEIFNQIFCWWWGYVPSLLFTWGQTMVDVMKIMVTSFRRFYACSATPSAPNPTEGHRWPTPPMESPGHSQASLGQSLMGSLLLSPGSWCTQDSVCALQESYFPVLCKTCLLTYTSIHKANANKCERGNEQQPNKNEKL